METQQTQQRPQSRGEKKKEQERTKIKKAEFLQAYSINMGSIGESCEKIGINRWTYYDWMSSDLVFRDKVHEIEKQRVDMTEDVIYKGIRNGDLPTARWYLQMTTGKYRAKQIIEHHTDEKTFEDVVDTMMYRLTNKKSKKKKDDSRADKGDAPSADRGEPAHTEQA